MDRSLLPSTSTAGFRACGIKPSGHARSPGARPRLPSCPAAESANGASASGASQQAKKAERRGTALGKTGAELREEFFLAASTGKERGLPEGAFLNDNTTGQEPPVEVTFQPWGECVTAPTGSNLLRAGVEAKAFEIGPAFCLTGQCDSCLVETDTGEAILACMSAVPAGREKMEVTVVASDEAWEAMCAGEPKGEGDEDFLFV